MIDEIRLTGLLRRWNAGEQDAEAVLMQIVLPAFHKLASSRLRRFAHSQLCPGELVNEAYLRLRWADIEWRGAEHFMSTVGRMMRNIIVDHERAKLSEKRGGGVAHVQFETLENAADDTDVEHALVSARLRETIGALRRVDARQSRVAELKLLWGLTNEEIARELAISRASAVRLWRAALAYFAQNSPPENAPRKRAARRNVEEPAELAL